MGAPEQAQQRLLWPRLFASQQPRQGSSLLWLSACIGVRLSAVSEDLEKPMEINARTFSQESRCFDLHSLKRKVLKRIASCIFLYCSSSQANCSLTEKELHQLCMDEEALREMLEEEAMNKRAQEEKIRQKQAEDDKFFLEFRVVRYDSEYESSD
ncbi:hypothetical protein Tco_0433411 [Tanacetum coccineum]